MPSFSRVPAGSARVTASSTPSAETKANVLAPRAVSNASVYSIDKLLALDHYTTTTSRWRVAGVLLVTPVPGLIAALLPAFVPLQDPLSPGGPRANPGGLVNMFLLAFIIGIGTHMHWRAGAELSHHSYTWWHIVAVSFISATLQYAFELVLIFFWRFPIPMTWIVISSSTSTAITIGHVIVFGKRLRTDTTLVEGIKRYIPALTFQSLQIVIYPAFSVLFDRVTSTYQVLLTLAFPLIKYFMKKGLRKYTRELKDFSSEVAVSGVEICASLYQSMILQNAPSQVAMTIIMVFDVLQGLFHVKFFLDRPSHTPRNQIIHEALKQLKALKPEGSAHLGKQCWVGESHTPVLPGNSVVPSPAEFTPDKLCVNAPSNGDAAQPRLAVPTTTRRASTKKTPVVVVDALRLVAVAESILLVEYIEVAIPLVNAVFISIACQFNGAQYNTRLRRLYFHPDALASAVQSIVLYSLLQALSFVAMHLVMRYRYGMSATYHLAFVLEHHWESIVGKMVGWLPIILHFTGIHYGVDFSFRFDFAAMLRDIDAH